MGNIFIGKRLIQNLQLTLVCCSVHHGINHKCVSYDLHKPFI